MGSKITQQIIKVTFQLRQTGASMVEIGRVVGVSDRTIAKILRGERPPPLKMDYETIINSACIYANTEKGKWERQHRQAGENSGTTLKQPELGRALKIFRPSEEKSEKLPLNTNPPISLIGGMPEDYFLKEKQ